MVGIEVGMFAMVVGIVVGIFGKGGSVAVGKDGMFGKDGIWVLGLDRVGKGFMGNGGRAA